MSQEKLDMEKKQVAHIDDANAEWNELRNDAMRAEENEMSMGLFEALRTYPTAAFWSFAISLCIVMEGYDTQVLGNIMGLDQFRQKFGHYVPGAEAGNEWQLETSWQTAVQQAPNIGCFIGIFISSWAQDRFGYRGTLQISLVLLTGFIFIVFFAKDVKILFAGELLCGLPWGAFSSSAVSYASDVTPIPLRGYLTTYINLCWIIGQFIGAGILRRVLTLPAPWGYRVPFAVQWAWPIPLFILVTLAPESPWYLVRKGRLDQAKRSIERLSSKSEKVDPAATVAMMVRTNEIEIQNEVGSTYADCYKGTDLRRTEISCMAWICQVLCGMVLCGSPVYFFRMAGLGEEEGFSMNLGVTGMAFVGTCLSWFALTYFGRRPVFIGGMIWMTACLIVIGGVAFKAQHDTGAKWAQAGLIMVHVFAYDFTVGPLTYCIVGETSATRLRSKTVGLARNSYNVTNVVAGILNTYMISAVAWNWAGKAALFWAAFSLLCTVWAYFRLPEMKGRSYRELDVLFEKRISARKFKETVVGEDEGDLDPNHSHTAPEEMARRASQAVALAAINHEH